MSLSNNLQIKNLIDELWGSKKNLIELNFQISLNVKKMILLKFFYEFRRFNYYGSVKKSIRSLDYQCHQTSLDVS